MTKRAMLALVLFALAGAFPALSGQQLDANQSAIAAKLRSIIVPKVDLHEASPSDVVEFLNSSFPEGDNKGTAIKFTLKMKPVRKDKPDEVSTVTFSAEDLSLLETARIAATMAGIGLKIDQNLVVLGDVEHTVQLPVSQEAIATFEKKLKDIVIPDIDLKDASIFDAVALLHEQSGPPFPAKGNLVNIILFQKGYDPFNSATMTYNAKNVPLLDALGAVCPKAGFTYTIEDGWVKVWLTKATAAKSTKKTK